MSWIKILANLLSIYFIATSSDVRYRGALSNIILLFVSAAPHPKIQHRGWCPYPGDQGPGCEGRPAQRPGRGEVPLAGSSFGRGATRSRVGRERGEKEVRRFAAGRCQGLLLCRSLGKVFHAIYQATSRSKLAI